MKRTAILALTLLLGYAAGSAQSKPALGQDGYGEPPATSGSLLIQNGDAPAWSAAISSGPVDTGSAPTVLEDPIPHPNCPVCNTPATGQPFLLSYKVDSEPLEARGDVSMVITHNRLALAVFVCSECGCAFGVKGD